MAREKLSKKDLMTVFWRSFAIMGSMNYERMQGLGYAWSLFPCLKKIYKDNKTKLCDALSRHMAAFNCATAPIPFIMGITLAMEEQNADNDEFDASAISTIKVALMGPLAGIGDAFFWGVFRVVSAGIGVSFASPVLPDPLQHPEYSVPLFRAVSGLPGRKLAAGKMDGFRPAGPRDQFRRDPGRHGDRLHDCDYGQYHHAHGAQPAGRGGQFPVRMRPDHAQAASVSGDRGYLRGA